MPDPSFIIPLFLQSALLPFAASLAALAVLGKPRLASVAQAAAIAFGLLASYCAVYHSQWAFPPRQALDLLPAVALLAVAGAAIAERARHAAQRMALRFAAALCVAAAAVWPA